MAKLGSLAAKPRSSPGGGNAGNGRREHRAPPKRIPGSSGSPQKDVWKSGMAPFPQDPAGRGRAALPGAFPVVPGWKIPVSFPRSPRGAGQSLLAQPPHSRTASRGPGRRHREPGSCSWLREKALESGVSEGEKNSGAATLGSRPGWGRGELPPLWLSLGTENRGTDPCPPSRP